MKWQIEVDHDGLKKYRLIKGSSRFEVEQKAKDQMNIWDETWQKKITAEKKKIEKITQERIIKEKIVKAEELTKSSQEQISKYENFLTNHLDLVPIKWGDGKDFSKFNEPQPKVEMWGFNGKKPLPSDFPPKIRLFEKRNKEKVEIKKKLAEKEYKKALDEYNKKFSENEVSMQKSNKELEDWKSKDKLFYENQKKHNHLIEKNKLDYENKNKSVISELCKIILSKFSYPEKFPRKFAVDFNSENSILIVDFALPLIENIPNLKEVKYIKSKDDFVNSYISDSTLKNIYDTLLYQIVLYCINELYKADYQEAIESIVFNGWVDTIDPGTGKDLTLCILSIQASREEFKSFDLKRVDPKECFKKLKGVSSTKLHTITPVAPIIKMDKEDKRFISSYDVIAELDDSENLALMDWEDFEHLIREIFEKEFTQNGGEVKVTQSSRDGGVDAIAFDPDPIRGGKIIIQAKRYTNVVGVSAVRDLYGTVVNEGATKGILVTTSNYGADAYNFAKGKPLTLLNGSNLLHLLEKHGQKAKIDLKEARRILDQNKE